MVWGGFVRLFVWGVFVVLFGFGVGASFVVVAGFLLVLFSVFSVVSSV